MKKFQTHRFLTSNAAIKIVLSRQKKKKMSEEYAKMVPEDPVLESLEDQQEKMLQAQREIYDSQKRDLEQTFDDELNELRERHQKELEEERQRQETNLAIIQEVLKLQTNLPSKRKNVNNIQEKINAICKEFNDLQDKANSMPQTSHESSDYQELLDINKKQLTTINRLIDTMRESIRRERDTFKQTMQAADDSFNTLLLTYKKAEEFKNKLYIEENPE